MAVEVENEANISLSTYLLYESFYGCHFRAVSVFLGGVPFSVEVLTA